MITTAPRTRWLAVLLLGTAFTLGGCYDDDDDYDCVYPPPPSTLPTAFATPTEFTWTGALSAYSATDEYLWTTTWDEVFIEFVGIDFFGQVRVQIFDSTLVQIFDETFLGGGDFQQVNLVSELGFAGDWTVIITSFDVFGQVTVRFD